MKIYHTLQIGSSHSNYCEDYLLIADIGEQKKLLAVLDGCTSGNESYFASTLSGKILRKVAEEQSFLIWKQGEPELPGLMKEILRRFFSEFKSIAGQLLLQRNDLLSTLILLLYDSKSKEGEILVIGDGVVVTDGKVYDFDQNNKPDYLGYHLDEDFETWYERQEQRITFRAPRDLSIASDGILSFDTFESKEYAQSIDALSFLVSDKQFEENDRMLDKKIRILEKGYGLKPVDDLALIRVIF